MSIAAPNWLLELGDPVGRADHPLKDEVAAAVDALPEDHRTAINMYFYEDLTYLEIAQAFGLAGKQGGAYRVRRAIQALTAELKERGLIDANPRT